jgi:putative component of toxin-antitoxin plasmid stabilization module
MTFGPVILIEVPAFSKHLDKLRPELQLVVKLALTEILAKEGLSLASSSWLRFVGDGVWEFRIGRSFKAVFSKAGIDEYSHNSNLKVLLRIFCSFEGNIILLLGCYDKQRHSDGKRQANAIRSAKEELLTFKRIR